MLQATDGKAGSSGSHNGPVTPGRKRGSVITVICSSLLPCMRLPKVEKTLVKDLVISWRQVERDGSAGECSSKQLEGLWPGSLSCPRVLVLKDYMHVDVHADGPACSFLKEMDCLGFTKRIQKKSHRAFVFGPS